MSEGAAAPRGAAAFALVDGLLEAQPSRASTVLVLGSPFGGTTMTAGLVQHLGVAFGDRASDKGEDVEMNLAVKRLWAGTASWRRRAVRREVAAIVDERCRRWGRWGMKVPRLVLTFPIVGDLFPNPRLVVVRRDVRAVAASMARRRALPVPLARARAEAYERRLTRIVAHRAAPMIVLSYEEALGDPRGVTERVAGFLGESGDERRLERAARSISLSGGYRPSRRVRGTIEEVGPTHVRGWVSDLLDDTASLAVRARVGTRRLADGLADQPRADVAAKGHHATGRCGFVLSFERLNSAERDNLVVDLPAIGHSLAFRLSAGGDVSLHVPRLPLPTNGNTEPAAAAPAGAVCQQPNA